MKVHINSLNHIAYKFVTQEALPKYEAMWKSQGDSDIEVTAKSFTYALGAKAILNIDVLEKMPLLKALTDKEGYIDLDHLKSMALETLSEFKGKNKEVILPIVNWTLDEDDVEKMMAIAKEYSQTNQKED